MMKHSEPILIFSVNIFVVHPDCQKASQVVSWETFLFYIYNLSKVNFVFPIQLFHLLLKFHLFFLDV